MAEPGDAWCVFVGGKPFLRTVHGLRWASIWLAVPEAKKVPGFGGYQNICCGLGLFDGLTNEQRQRWRKLYRQGWRCHKVTIRGC